MSDFKPLVVDPSNDPPLKQLQVGDDLDIPLAQRVCNLEYDLKQMAELLYGQGLEVPPQLLE